MAARSIASLTLSFGLVSIPVKLYSATESASGVGFNSLIQEGGRVKQQYISEATRAVLARAEMKKGYEFEKGQFVVFAPDELKARSGKSNGYKDRKLCGLCRLEDSQHVFYRLIPCHTCSNRAPVLAVLT